MPKLPLTSAAKSGEPLSVLHLLAFHLWSGPAEPTANLLLAQRAAGLKADIAFDTIHAETECEEPIAPRLNALGITPVPGLAMSPKSKPWHLLKDSCRLRQLAANYQIIHAHMSHDHQLALISFCGKRARLVRTIHSARSFGTGSGRALPLKKAAGLIVPTAFHKEWLINKLAIPKEKIAVIPPGIESAYWREEPNEEAIRALNLPPGPKVALIAMMQKDRGHEELLHAFRQVVQVLPNARLILAGEGEGMPRFKELAQELSLGQSVHFSGYLLKNDLRALYHSIDLAVLINTGNDLSARAMGEAFAAGVPVVALNTGDPYLKLRRAALLAGAAAVSPLLVAEEGALGQAISRLLGDKELLLTLGEKAKKLAGARTIEGECTATRAFYEQILST